MTKLLRKSRYETTKYILDEFPYRLYLEFHTFYRASQWIENDTNWVNLVGGWGYGPNGTGVMYDLCADGDYARWMMNGEGSPPTFFFRDHKHAIWFKLNWGDVKD